MVQPCMPPRMRPSPEGAFKQAMIISSSSSWIQKLFVTAVRAHSVLGKPPLWSAVPTYPGHMMVQRLAIISSMHASMSYQEMATTEATPASQGCWLQELHKDALPGCKPGATIQVEHCQCLWCCML